MKNKIRNLAVMGLLIAFLAPLSGMAVNLVMGLQDISVTEKRRLAAPPHFDGNLRTYAADWDDYFEDHFGFRMPMIRLARKVRDNFGENPVDVAYGKDGWLFLGQNAYRDEFEGNGFWDRHQVNGWINSFTDVKERLDRDDIPFAAFIAPDKSRIYPEYVPDDWTISPRRFRAAVHAHPDVAETGLIDAEPLVLAAKDRGELAFFQRDTHWTAAGTYDLAMAVMDALDPDQTRPRYIPGPPTEREAPRLADLDGLAGFATSQEPRFTMIPFPPGTDGDRSLMHQAADGTVPRGEMATLMIRGTPDAPPGRLVIVGDSFGDAMVGHFRPSYAEIVRIHHGAHFFNINLAEVMAYKPDAVLFATAERQAVRKARPFLPVPLERR